MNRDRFLQQLTADPGRIWDVIIIGGGATGLGCAVDAASRGYATLLVEQADFAKGTTSRSTKLIHGGVRYLAQGDLSLVFEALHERGLMMQNAPHLVRNQQFIIPVYEWWEGPFYNVGMKFYDVMAGRMGLGPSEKISREETLAAIPNLDQKGLLGGVIYYDGQFDDARLAVNLAQTAADNGAVCLNYLRATGLTRDDSGLLDGVELEDQESGKKLHAFGRVIINAAGMFVGEVQAMAEKEAHRAVLLSRGVHIVLDHSFLQGEAAIMIPHTSDGRVLFAVPWHDKVIVGTTDTEVEEPLLEPRASTEEIEFILKTCEAYLNKDPRPSDILSVFAGLRPLAVPEEKSGPTKDVTRKHQILISPSGLITVTGGKWTIYRKMAEDAIDKAVQVGGLPEKACATKTLPVHGYLRNMDFDAPLSYYGSDRLVLEETVMAAAPANRERLHPAFPYLKGEVVWAVRHEMARRVEDFLARRVRALFLDARSSIAAAPAVAEIMARELGKDAAWARGQVEAYTALAKGYLVE